MGEFHGDVAAAANGDMLHLPIDQIRKQDAFDGRAVNFESWAFPFQMTAHHPGWAASFMSASSRNFPAYPMLYGSLSTWQRTATFTCGFPKDYKVRH